jgi:hypothetical protein
MASEQQIAANRRNAQKSTGPRSVEGKKCASRNAYRHGLAAAIGNSRKSAAKIDSLASEIAATARGSAVAAADAEILEFARTAAQAELDLARIRGMKTLTMSSLLPVASLPVAAVTQITVDLALTAHADELQESLTEFAITPPIRATGRGTPRPSRSPHHRQNIFVSVGKKCDLRE